MSAAAARQRRYRQRQAAGLVAVEIELDEDDIETLAAARLIDPMVDPTREAIAGAIKRLLRTIRHEGDASRR